MPKPSKPMGPTRLHMMPQRAHALLWPIRLDLAEKAELLQHYLDRADLSPEDAEALRAAKEAIARAHAEVERLWKETGQR